MKNIFIWIKNNISKIILILSAPFAIILFLRLGNLISAQTGINLNPSGVGNAEWFLFWAAYIAGICTLIAFLSTIKENRKDLEYQAEMESIAQEQKELSNIIAGLCLRDIYDIFIKYFSITHGTTESQVHDLGQLSYAIIDIRKNILTNDMKLRLNTNIINSGCSNCENIEICLRGKFSTEFMENYDFIYNYFYTSLTRWHKHIQNEKILHQLPAKQVESSKKL